MESGRRGSPRQAAAGLKVSLKRLEQKTGREIKTDYQHSIPIWTLEVLDRKFVKGMEMDETESGFIFKDLSFYFFIFILYSILSIQNITSCTSVF